MNQKIISSVLILLVIALGISTAHEHDTDIAEKVKVSLGKEGIDYSGETKIIGESVDANSEHTIKYVYGSGSDVNVEKCEAHCRNAGGTFNTCGSLCPEGQACPAVCVYTCDDVKVESSDPVFKSSTGGIEVEYKAVESKYDVKYDSGYNFDTAMDIKGVSQGKVEVFNADGDVKSVNVNPEDAVRNAFGTTTTADGVTIKLEEKTYNNVPAVVYKIDADTEGKFLGLFKISARYQSEVDAETGDVLDWNGPWWAFLIVGEQQPVEPEVKGKEANTNNDMNDSDDSIIVTDFNTCVDAGYSVQESNPRQCLYKGNVFVEII